MSSTDKQVVMLTCDVLKAGLMLGGVASAYGEGAPGAQVACDVLTAGLMLGGVVNV